MGKRNFLPKLIITDIDGVWTDGGMYYDQTGNELKRFHTYDSAGILFCHKLNIPVAIISGENTKIVENRALKLNIDYVFLGIKDKLAVAENLCKDLKLSLTDIAYIGDDINDIPLLKKAGLSACPNNSPCYIKKYAKMKLKKNGGNGVFREFIEKVLGYKIISTLID